VPTNSENSTTRVAQTFDAPVSLSIKQHSRGVLLDLRPSKRLGFRLAVTLPQDLKIAFLWASGLEHSCYLELALWSPVLDEIGRNAPSREVNRIQGN
jgi:hypothetical protein